MTTTGAGNGIGVEVDIAFDGVTPTGLSVTLGGASTKTTVTIRDASGQAVRTMEVGPHPIGTMPIAWESSWSKRPVRNRPPWLPGR